MGTTGYHKFELRAGNNLSDVPNPALARANLGAAAVASGVEDALAIVTTGQTTFTMSAAETHAANLIVHVGGAYVPVSHYTVSGVTLTYSGALPLQSGDTLYVRHAFNL